MQVHDFHGERGRAGGLRHAMRTSVASLHHELGSIALGAVTFIL